ncbi:IS66 family insertion sequence element accessory protein TnpA [Azospirillum sp. B2RO_4]|uniref:IS66 family insertion sequence element accessory protein TnpA n=1 Tax=Azospirillum sp. B2RO_4 TaxID=3027796 RepID=UPI003DA80CA6
MMDQALESYWRGHVEAWKGSGLTLKAYAEVHGTGRWALGRWLPILHRWKWRTPLLGVQTLAPVREPGSPRVILDTGLILEQGRVYPQPVPLP